MSTIYQDIWNADQAHNGIAALRPGEDKNHDRGFVIVNELATRVDDDHRVIQDVVIPESKQTTYQRCEALFDNYALERRLREDHRFDESEEENQFIDAIIDTPPIQLARRFLESSLGVTISNNTLAAMITETWFSIGRAGSQPDASGFEHVFVGEQGGKPSHVGGYHFWYKYWIDDGGQSVSGDTPTDRIRYLGTQYGKAEQPDKGILIPEVITLQLEWDAPPGDINNPGNLQSKRLKKPIGGFFVGISPEGLIALGLVRARSASIGKLATINGADYQLDLHRLDQNPKAIRTFFPRFIRANVTDITTEPVVEPIVVEPEIPDQPGNAPAFTIIAAMVNPKNPEGGREFLQLINRSAVDASLKDWTIIAPNGTAFVLNDILLSPGDIYKFVWNTEKQTGHHYIKRPYRRHRATL